MGCLSRIGCLTVTVAGAAVVWWLNGGGVPEVVRRAGASVGLDVGTPRETRPLAWANVTGGGASAARIVAPLTAARGPAFVTLDTKQVADLFGAVLRPVLAGASGRLAVAVDGDRLHLRTVADLRTLVGDSTMGGLAGEALGRALGTLTGRDTLAMSGTLSLARPGVAAYVVRSIELGGITLPSRAVPWLVDGLRRRAGVDSVAPGALPVPLPSPVADVRISNARVTLYRASP